MRKSLYLACEKARGESGGVRKRAMRAVVCVLPMFHLFKFKGRESY